MLKSEEYLGVHTDLLETFDPENSNFRPTEIYHEGWLLREFLHHAAQTDLGDSPLAFAEGSTWFSEALLLTAFKARGRGDLQTESRTHADGVIEVKTCAPFEKCAGPGCRLPENERLRFLQNTYA